MNPFNMTVFLFARESAFFTKSSAKQPLEIQKKKGFSVGESEIDGRRERLIAARIGAPPKASVLFPGQITQTLPAPLGDIKPAGWQRVVANLNRGDEGRIGVKQIRIDELVCNQLEQARLKILRV
jgi:hypothetical protein